MAGIFKIIFLMAFFVAIVMSQDYDGGFDGGDIVGAGDGEGEFAESGGSFDGGESQADFDVAEPSENHETTHSVQKRSADYVRANRVRRGGHGYVGPVYTYVKTDHHGNFKWGARHLVGSKYGHGGHGGHH